MHHILTPYLRWLIALSLVLLGPMIQAEDSWVVQVGAYSAKPNGQMNAFMEELRALQNDGPVLSSVNERGLNVLSIGPFTDRTDAQAALYNVQTLAPDAYIRRVSSDPQDTVQGPAQPVPADQGVAPVAVANAGSDAAALLNQLPADERRNVVMLDGRLHYKDGERFTPLVEYLSNR
jgi:hypothetical protein